MIGGHTWCKEAPNSPVVQPDEDDKGQDDLHDQVGPDQIDPDVEPVPPKICCHEVRLVVNDHGVGIVVVVLAVLVGNVAVAEKWGVVHGVGVDGDGLRSELKELGQGVDDGEGDDREDEKDAVVAAPEIFFLNLYSFAFDRHILVTGKCHILRTYLCIRIIII